MLDLLRWLGVLFALIFFVGSAHRTTGHHKDFITHWTLARLAVEGKGSAIYDLDEQTALLRATLPPERLGFLESSHIKGVGVSPYPPIMAVLYAPLGLLSPQAAQWCVVQLSVLAGLGSGWAISRSSQGRVPLSAALLAIFWFPGFFYTVALGQNALLTLLLLALGWWALTERRDVLAGLIWGLLVYKVHWLVAVAWVPAALGRWRVYLGLSLPPLVLAAGATLWFGPEVWGAWLGQARSVGAAYHDDPVFRNSILGRACDLRAASTRFLPGLPSVATWAVLAVPALVAVVRLGRSWPLDVDSPAAPALLFTAYLVAPYVFYYDTTLLVLPVLLVWGWRADLAMGGRWALVGLTGALFGVLPLMEKQGWQGPPWMTGVAVALWGLSLTLPTKSLATAREPLPSAPKAC